ncbi:MAG: c-type cytochrome [Novosphingobium sp.]
MALALVAALSPTAASTSQPIEQGRDIYELGRGGAPIMVRQGRSGWQDATSANACRSCHGDSGEGGSEGTISAPVLASSTDQAGVYAKLRSALFQHRSANGGSLGAAMPRYRMSEGDLQALASYIAALPGAPSPGVSTKAITISLSTVGAPISPEARAILQKALAGLAAGSSELFGRTVRFADEAEGEGLITVAWNEAVQSRQPVFRLRPDGASNAKQQAPGCGTLDADHASRQRATADWLERQGVSYTVAVAAGQSGTDAAAVIYPADLAVLPTQLAGFASAYVPAETVSRWPGTDRPANLSIVSPGNIEQRVAAARRIIAEDRVTSQEALIIAVYLEAASQVIDSLRAEGRRVRRMSLCDQLGNLAKSRQTLSIITGDKVTLVKIYQ